MPFGPDAGDQVEHPPDVGASKINREEDDFQALFVRKARGLDRSLNRLFERPAIRLFDNVLAGWNFHYDACDAAVNRAFDVVYHAARKAKNLRSEIALGDFFDGRLVGRRNSRHTRFDAMDPGFRERLGDGDLVVLVENDPGLLLAIAQGDVVYLDLARKIKAGADFFGKVPGAYKPLIGLPGLVWHSVAPCNVWTRVNE